MKNDNTEYYTTVIVEYYLTTLPTPAVTASLGYRSHDEKESHLTKPRDHLPGR